jgi:hypothetical protein
MMTDYLRWKDLDQEAYLKSDTAPEVVADDTSKAMLCPKTGRLMTKYLISKDSDHRLDLSPTINAIWMDAGEWELIKANGLAGNLNTIFTRHWQHEIRSQASADVLSAMYQDKFGEQYAELKAFKETLNSMEARSEAIAYLIAEDPYEA